MISYRLENEDEENKTITKKKQKKKGRKFEVLTKANLMKGVLSVARKGRVVFCWQRIHEYANEEVLFT